MINATIRYTIIAIIGIRIFQYDVTISDGLPRIVRATVSITGRITLNSDSHKHTAAQTISRIE